MSAVLLTLAVALLLYRPSRRAVRVRVGTFIPIAGQPDAPAGTELKLRRTVTPRFLESGTWWAPFVEDVQVARSPHTPVYLVKRAAVIAVVLAGVAVLLIGSVLVALIPLLLWPFPLRAIVSREARKQRELFGDTLPTYLQDLASAIRVGRSFVGGADRRRRRRRRTGRTASLSTRSPTKRSAARSTNRSRL